MINIINSLFCIVLLYAEPINAQVKIYSLDDLLSFADKTNDYLRSVSDSITFENNQKIFKIQVLPSASISATVPSLNNSITSVTQPDGSDRFVNRFSATSNMSLNLSQLLPFTGGTISATSSLVRLDNFEPSRTTSYSLSLLNLSYSQNLSGYNSFKWEKKRNDVEAEKFRINFIQSRERIYAQITSLFFELYLAQEQYRILTESQNLANKLCQKAESLYKQGKISHEDYLDAQIDYKTAQLNYSQESIIKARKTLADYLNLNEDDFEVTYDQNICKKQLFLDEQTMVERMIKYSVNLQKKSTDLQNTLQLKQIKSYGAPTVSLSFSSGLNSQAEQFKQLFGPYNTQMSVVISFSIPILNWGKYRLQYKNAKESIKMSEVNYDEQIQEIVKNGRYEVHLIQNLKQEIEIGSDLINLMNQKMETLQKKVEYGKVEALEISKLRQSLIQKQIDNINKIRNLYSIIYKYRQQALYDMLTGLPIL